MGIKKKKKKGLISLFSSTSKSLQVPFGTIQIRWEIGLICLAGSSVTGLFLKSHKLTSKRGNMYSKFYIIKVSSLFILYRLLIQFGIRILKRTENGKLLLQNLLNLFPAFMGFITVFSSKTLFFVLFSTRGHAFKIAF